MKYFFHRAFILRLSILFILPAFSMILPQCSWVAPPSPEIPLDRSAVKKLIDRVSQDYNRASTFISSGKVTFGNWAWGAESNILIIGQRKPLRLKIELTHSWGRPILHLLIRQEKLEILSFSEGRLYKGTYSPGTLSKFINVYAKIEYLWAILRAYPEPESYDHLILSGPNQLILADQNGKELEKIGLNRNTTEISSISFPGSEIKITFSEYKTEKGIPYAAKVRVDTNGTKHLVLFNENMVFNRQIPKAIFRMRIPPDFEIVNLDRMSAAEGMRGRGD